MNNKKALFVLVSTIGFIIAFAGGLALAETPHSSKNNQVHAAGATVEYTLMTGGNTGQLVFVGMGGTIDGEVNPTLHAKPGDVVKITLVNGDGMLHDLTIDDFHVATKQFADKGEQDSVTFQVNDTGEFEYYCSVPGHRAAGMHGTIEVGSAERQEETGANIIHNPTDLPGPVGDRAPQTVRVDLTAEEVVGQLADGTTMTYFTFNGTVPGPMIRVRVDDTVEVHFRNDTSSQFPHSVDFHAATGPGGGAMFSNMMPGEETVFTFKVLKPGLFVYHCATPSVAHHIQSGMYGMILVEPEGGLPPVDHEFYVMQGEIYTQQPFGTPGYVTFSNDKMMAEQPEYFVFNGAVNALTADDEAMHAKVGDTVRIFFGVGGPDFTSSFHVIGEIMDRVYQLGSLTTPPITDVQTASVPPGGAAMVELKFDVPGRYPLVDHALTRAEQGLMAYIYVDGDPQPDIYNGTPSPHASGH